MNISRDEKVHVDHNVTFSFKVTREGHAIGNSWIDFFDLKNLGNKKVHYFTTTTTILKNHALKNDVFDVIDDVIGSCNSSAKYTLFYDINPKDLCQMSPLCITGTVLII